MPVQTQIQVRRSTAATWTSTNPTLASGEIGFETDANKFKIGNGSDTWNSLAYANDGDITAVTAGIGISGGGISGNVTITNAMATAIDAKGDLIIGTGADTFSRLAVGANNQILVADSATTTGTKWADNTAPFDIAITVPAGTQKDSVSATYSLPAGVYTVQATGSSLNTVVYGANSFTPGTAANAIIQNLASPASTISLTLNRTWTGTMGLGVAQPTQDNSFSFQNGFFTVSGNNASVAEASWSTNGTFTAFTNIGFYNSSPAGPQKVIRSFDNTQWVAIGRNFSPITIIATSPNGSTWTTRASVNTELNNLLSAPSQYVAFGSGGALATSPNAITWTSRAAGFANTRIGSIIFANSLYVGGDWAGNIRTSTDAITWTARTSNFGLSRISNIIYANSIFIAVGNSGGMTTSTDGITWTSRNPGVGAGENIQGVGWDGTNYAVGAQSTIRTSTDLITWTTRTGTNFGNQLASNNISGAGNVGITFPQAGIFAGSGAFTTVSLAGATATSSFTRFNLGTPVTAS